MDPIYQLSFEVSEFHADRFGRLKSSSILSFVQEAACRHWQHIEGQTGEKCQLYWVIIRHRVQVTRLPRVGQTVRLETWPMPTTRVAYPRSIVAYDEAGNEVFRAITLWVLMDLNDRSMVLPGKSGIDVTGTLRGNELASPLGLPAKVLANHRKRYVNFTDLDRNAHMNNTRYLDWIYDLLGADFHKDHSLREFTLCYLNEAREGQQLELSWDFPEAGCLMMEAHRNTEDKSDRVFAAKLLFD